MPGAPSLLRSAPYLIARQLIRILMRLFLRVEVHGRHLVPSAGGCLIIANHTSFLDPPVIGSVLQRRVRFLARSTLFRHRAFGPLIENFGAHPIERNVSDRRGMTQCVGLLEEGFPVVMFPEGTRGRGPEPAPFRRGFLLLVKRARVPVVPVGIRGLQQVLPRGRRLPRPGRVRIRFGRPIPWREVAQMGAAGVRERVIELMQE